MMVHWRAFKKGNCVKAFVSCFRKREERAERIMTTHPWNCYHIKPVFHECTDFLMQLGILPLDNEIAILCHRINDLSGSFKRFQDGEFEDSSTGCGRQAGLGLGEKYFQKLPWCVMVYSLYSVDMVPFDSFTGEAASSKDPEPSPRCQSEQYFTRKAVEKVN